MPFETKDSKKLRALSPEKLAQELADAAKELYATEHKIAAGEQKDTAARKGLRRYVARLKTIANETK